MINLNKSIFVFYLLAAMFIQSCSTNTSNSVSPDQEKEKLLKRLEQFNSAFKNGEVETLESLITDNYIHTNSSSKSIRKDNWVAYLQKRRKELASGELVVNNYKMDETEIELHDDMAIVTAKISFSSTRSGEQKENEFRVTNVWVKEEGLWKRAGFHDTRIK